MTAKTHCPLCAEKQCSFFYEDARRPYFICGCCALVFVPSKWHLSAAQERAEYELHENEVDDPGYRRFLSRLSEPLLSRLGARSSGLDFGCGPGPALAHILRAAGHEVALYDSFFAPDSTVLECDYDFICATEVVEHLHAPGRELQRLWALLKPGGWLGVMTKLVRGREAFSTWHYKNDQTHVCFFSEATWQWWAKSNAAAIEIIGADVILLQRPG